MWFITATESGLLSDPVLFLDPHLWAKGLKIVGYGTLVVVVFLLLRRILALHALARLGVSLDVDEPRRTVVQAGATEAVKVTAGEAIAVFVAHLFLFAGVIIDAIA